MAQYIPLSQGQFAIVDDDDFEKINTYKWCIKKTSHNLYAKRVFNMKTIDMHRFIMNPKIGYVIDHINGDGLDNRKENLRICTHSENMKNIKVRKDNTSELGVYIGKRKLINGIVKYNTMERKYILVYIKI